MVGRPGRPAQDRQAAAGRGGRRQRRPGARQGAAGYGPPGGRKRRRAQRRPAPSPARERGELSMSARLLTLLLVAGLALSGPAAANEEHDQAVARLAAELQALEADPSLGDLARLERLQARQAIADARDARRRDREHKLGLAGVRLETARLAAEAELLASQAEQLDRER